MYYRFFPEELIELQRELATGGHDTLCRVLNLIPDWEDRLAAIATHCDVLVDGEYSQDMLRQVYKTLTEKLKDKREPPAPAQNIILLN